MCQIAYNDQLPRSYVPITLLTILTKEVEERAREYACFVLME